ncbi:MAG: hypothetical protein ACPG7F_19170 [Aggregatilineales bacterium]
MSTDRKNATQTPIDYGCRMTTALQVSTHIRAGNAIPEDTTPQSNTTRSSYNGAAMTYRTDL